MKWNKKGKLESGMVLSSAIFLVLVAALASPLYVPVLAGNSSIFNVSLTISNSVPAIDLVDAAATSPAEGTTKVLSIHFNASDENGVSDIPASNALAVVNKSAVSHSSGAACIVLESSSTVNRYECNVTIDYFDAPGAWTINASVFDGASALAEDLSQTLTMGTTYGISLKTDSLTFSGSPGENDVNASNNPQVVNNTGNAAFASLNITGYELKSGGTTISASNFAVNTTDSPAGPALVNGSDVLIANSAVGVQGTAGVFVYLDIPVGVSNGTYNSVDSWVITAS